MPIGTVPGPGCCGGFVFEPPVFTHGSIVTSFFSYSFTRNFYIPGSIALSLSLWEPGELAKETADRAALSLGEELIMSLTFMASALHATLV